MIDVAHPLCQQANLVQSLEWRHPLSAGFHGDRFTDHAFNPL